MIFDEKKFGKEIKALPKIMPKPPSLSEAEILAMKNRVLTQIAEVKTPALSPDHNNLMRHIISVLLGLSLVAGTAFASDSASPGDALYPIKLAKEKIQLNLTISQEAKARLQEKFAEQRLVELQEISSQNALPFSGSKDHGKNSSGLSGDQTDELNGDSSATTTLESQKHHKLQIEAKDSADAAVSAAVRALGDVQKKLKAKGQEQSADSINRDIIRLRQKAQDQGLDVPESNNRQQTPEGASLSTNASTSLTNDIFNEQGLNQ